MFPYPSGDGPARRPPARLHRHRRVRPLPAHERASTSCTRWATTRSGCPPSSTRCRPASTRGSPPRQNIATMRRQLRALGLGHDPRRGVADHRRRRTTAGRSGSSCRSSTPGTTTTPIGPGPIAELVDEFESARASPSATPIPTAIPWDDLDDADAARASIDSYRLAYLDEAPVNWCPALGTVLANEEVTADGRSERGNFPVYKRPLKQWMLRITAYADRLLADLDLVDWPESIKLMQRNWIGRSIGANVAFPVEEHEDVEIEVFTTRPDTLFGATYMVLAPEHPLVDEIVRRLARRGFVDESAPGRRWKGMFGIDGPPADAVRRYREFAGGEDRSRAPGRRAREDRRVHRRVRDQPRERRSIPIFIADYVLMGYGTGAIMAVPGARRARLGVRARVRPADRPRRAAARRLAGDRGSSADTPATNGPRRTSATASASTRRATRFARRLATPTPSSASSSGSRRDGSGRADGHLQAARLAVQPAALLGRAVPDRLRRHDRPVALPESMLPVELPEITDFEPTHPRDDPTTRCPSRRWRAPTDWVEVELDLGRRAGYGRTGTARRTRCRSGRDRVGTTCATSTRPTRTRWSIPRSSAYWMAGDVRRTPVGRRPLRRRRRARGAAPAVRALLAQGAVRPRARVDARAVPAAVQPGLHPRRGVHRRARHATSRPPRSKSATASTSTTAQPVTREFGKMGKSLKNAVAPDDIYRDYGADTLRLYEMFMGPLDASRPWNTADIIGVHRFLQRLWRNVVDEETGDAARRATSPADDETRRLLHRTIAAVRARHGDAEFNTAIARLFELNNHLTQVVQERGSAPAEVVDAAGADGRAARAAHRRGAVGALGHADTLAYEPFPEADPALLVDDDGRGRRCRSTARSAARIMVPGGADDATHEAAAPRRREGRRRCSTARPCARSSSSPAASSTSSSQLTAAPRARRASRAGDRERLVGSGTSRSRRSPVRRTRSSALRASAGRRARAATSAPSCVLR